MYAERSCIKSNSQQLVLLLREWNNSNAQSSTLSQQTVNTQYFILSKKVALVFSMIKTCKRKLLEMNMKKSFLLLIALFTTVSSFAHQFSWSNFYLDGFGGVNFVRSLEENDVLIDFRTGYAMGGGVGYRLTPFFCLEGETAFRENKVDGLKVHDISLGACGNLQSVSAMFNGIFEQPVLEGCLIPYCGLGLGQQWERFKFKIDPIVTPEGVYVFKTFRENCRGPAYQGIVGLNFIVLSKSTIGAEYRYLNHFDSDPGSHTLAFKLTSYF